MLVVLGQISSYRSALVIWALFFCVALFGSLFQIHASTWGLIFVATWVLTGFTLLREGENLTTYKTGFVVVAALFIYSMFMSVNTARSTFLALPFLFSFLFFITLSDLQARASEQLNSTRSSNLDILDLSKLAVLVFALGNAALLITQYLSSPIRSFGFFLDYGQSALILLIAFALNYSVLKEFKVSRLFITFILFIGFFTTFSRITTFLLLVLLAAMAILYVRFKKSTLQLLLLSTTIVCAYFVVLAVPALLDATTVDRNTMAHLKSLNSRIFYWDAAIVDIKDNIFWGYGLGNFEFLGIKKILPFDVINSAHNDYLQVWVDLGVFWFTGFVASLAYAIVYFFPHKILSRRVEKFSKDDLEYLVELLIKQGISWCLLVCLALYMLVNFVVYAFAFQLVFCVLLVDLIHTKKAIESVEVHD